MILKHTPERSGNGGNNLADESIQVCVCRAFNVQVTSANVIDSFIINHKSTVRMFQSCMSGQNRIVRFYHSCRDLKAYKLPFKNNEIIHYIKNKKRIQ